LKSDLDKWERLAAHEFTAADFCSKEYLLEHWKKLKGYVLQYSTGEWIGVVFLDFAGLKKFNPEGCHILEVILFPKFRNSVYLKHLGKIIFDNAKGYRKSAYVRPKNRAPTEIMKHLGFKNAGRKWYFSGLLPGFWNNWTCESDFYPDMLENVKLEFKNKTTPKKNP